MAFGLFCLFFCVASAALKLSRLTNTVDMGSQVRMTATQFPVESTWKSKRIQLLVNPFCEALGEVRTSGICSVFCIAVYIWWEGVLALQFESPRSVQCSITLSSPCEHLLTAAHVAVTTSRWRGAGSLDG